jgi:hypothetical protein
MRAGAGQEDDVAADRRVRLVPSVHRSYGGTAAGPACRPRAAASAAGPDPGIAHRDRLCVPSGTLTALRMSAGRLLGGPFGARFDQADRGVLVVC